MHAYATLNDNTFCLGAVHILGYSAASAGKRLQPNKDMSNWLSPPLSVNDNLSKHECEITMQSVDIPVFWYLRGHIALYPSVNLSTLGIYVR